VHFQIINNETIERPNMKTISTIPAALLLASAAILALAPPAVAQAIASAQPPGALTKDDDKAIRKTLMGVETAWNTHDMKAFGSLFTEDAEWINIVGMHWRGREAVVKAHAIFHEIMFKNHQLKTDDIKVRSLGGSHAIAVVTTTNDAFTTPDGRVMERAQNRLTYVLSNGPDGWKIAHGHNVRVDADAANNDPVNSRPK